MWLWNEGIGIINDVFGDSFPLDANCDHWSNALECCLLDVSRLRRPPKEEKIPNLKKSARNQVQWNTQVMPFFKRASQTWRSQAWKGHVKRVTTPTYRYLGIPHSKWLDYHEIPLFENTMFENYSQIFILASKASYDNFVNAFLPLKNSSQFCDFTVYKESASI